MLTIKNDSPRYFTESESPRASLARALELMFVSLKEAEAAHPEWPDDPVHGAGIVAEEAGEALKAAISLYQKNESPTRESLGPLQKETAQAGAVCLRLLVWIEQELMKMSL